MGSGQMRCEMGSMRRRESRTVNGK
jgi:hypothetical protein